MVDPIKTGGNAAISGRDLVVPRVAPVTTPAPVAAREATQDSASLSNVAATLSTAAPVDVDRVAKVKKAIADGKFPILPVTIADRLIAYKLEWIKNDEA
jgi:negative regulator of flagellin synthesis FlgM